MGLGLVSGPFRIAEPRKAKVQLRRRVRVRPVRGRRPETGLSVRDIERPRKPQGERIVEGASAARPRQREQSESDPIV